MPNRRDLISLVVIAIQTFAIVTLLVVDRNHEEPAARWRDIASRWQANSNAFEAVAQQNLDTANSCLVTLYQYRKIFDPHEVPLFFPVVPRPPEADKPEISQ